MKRILLAVICAVLLLAGCGVQEDKAAFAAASKLLEERQYAEAEAAFSRLADREIFTAQSYRGMGIAQLMRSAYSESSISFAKAKLNGTQLSPEFQRDVDKYLAYCALKLGKQVQVLRFPHRKVQEQSAVPFPVHLVDIKSLFFYHVGHQMQIARTGRNDPNCLLYPEAITV